MSRPVLHRLGLAAAAALLPTVAFAHTGVGEAGGFAHGFLHPLTGLDHLLAMVMVGMLAWQLGGHARWLVPASFVVVMALGGSLGVAGTTVPFVELGIALSVVVLGSVVALGMRLPVAAAMAVAGLFAIFHGHAHGQEMPADVLGLSYGAGFMVGTALLHTAGLGLGMLIGRIGDRAGQVGIRATGAAAAIAGVVILTGAV
ncbi:MAG TPA: HupE/UreJ family protein [Geminicoccus sp.]|uniref:HupE/UreJ family protein n=1 Tax=Geminicoccus sp. TaxID=2024832 RepID=UPI002E30054E|nr:HupE/UreJ family protein [Geminicoccus sp.]HEX2529585.1 HupE/UreJ family protein [Geminicoccus sp.]